MPDHLAVTRRYYATWLDVAPEQLDAPGAFAVASPKREARQAGYSRPFDLYAYVTGETTVISYHRRLADCIEATLTAFRDAADLTALEACLPSLLEAPSARVGHSFKYVFTSLPHDVDPAPARQLEDGDYADFLGFHRAHYQDADQDLWLRDYFDSLVARGYLHGVEVDGRLVCAAEVPDLPYLVDLVAEPGIATLPAYRRCGYARAAVGALLARLLDEGKTPLWSCAATNVASQRLAESLGFTKLADVITVTLA
ncbi:MAG: GNAT family N-acetyltransferase [Anaerolineae bacterium]|nr:GNAT family N-acetyltransferase [Anaerolineae bacterium]